MEDEEIARLEKIVHSRELREETKIRGNETFLKRLLRIHRLCLNGLIPKPRGWFKRTCPMCGEKLKVRREGPFALGKCVEACGYEYVYELYDEKDWNVESWSKYYNWGKELS